MYAPGTHTRTYRRTGSASRLLAVLNPEVHNCRVPQPSR